MLVKDKNTHFLINDDESDYRKTRQAYAQASKMKNFEERLTAMEAKIKEIHDHIRYMGIS